MLLITQMSFDGSKKINQIESSRESSYFLFEDGTAQSCGRNDEGQLGDGTFVNSNEGSVVKDVDVSEKIINLGSGPSSQSVFFIGEKNVWAAGLNDRYQLGINEIESRNVPVMVEFEGPVEVSHISSSGSHSVAIGRYLS